MTGLIIRALAAGVLIVAGCGGNSGRGYDPVPKGSRVLAIDVKAAADDDYNGAFLVAEVAGAENIKISLDWKYTQEDSSYAVVDIADVYYPLTSMSLSLVLRPVNTNMTTLPTGVTEPFDQVATINAFNTFVDGVFSHVPNLRAAGRITSIHVGNEIDAYLGTNSTAWAAYEAFFDAAAAHIASLDWGGPVTVSTIATFDGLIDPVIGPILQSIFLDTDTVTLTYYPWETDLLFRDPSTVFADFQAVVDLYPGRTIEFIECGYPSGTVCGGSEARQEAFVRNVFRAWDTHAALIAKVDFSWETDVSEAAADQWVIDYGMTAHPHADRFKDFLWTLGLRTYSGSGTDKPAFTALAAEAATRGW